MDNNKIGKLIAKLRRKKGLTQQELADMFGIGYRAVSNWERGNCLPDISIINELSNILGISSDELLNGEINSSNEDINKIDDNIKENKMIKKKDKYKKLFIVIISFVLIILVCILIKVYLSNKTYKYELVSTSDEYIIDGYIELYKDNLSLVIDRLEFTDKEFLNTEIINYDYQIMLGDELVFGYANKNETRSLENFTDIVEFIDNFKINYNEKRTSSDIMSELINVKINISFQLGNDELIKKEINVITK